MNTRRRGETPQDSLRKDPRFRRTRGVSCSVACRPLSFPGDPEPVLIWPQMAMTPPLSWTRKSSMQERCGRVEVDISQRLQIVHLEDGWGSASVRYLSSPVVGPHRHIRRVHRCPVGGSIRKGWPNFAMPPGRIRLPEASGPRAAGCRASSLPLRKGSLQGNLVIF